MSKNGLVCIWAKDYFDLTKPWPVQNAQIWYKCMHLFVNVSQY